jgi:signal peptidase I
MKQQSPKGRVRRAITAVFLILLIATVVFLRLSVFTPFVVLLNSMEPTLHENDHVLVNRWAYRHQLPQPGDIILFQHPEEPPPSLMVKRVIGVPGDHLAVVRGYVMRNGKPLDERAYTLQNSLMVAPEWEWGTVPPDTVFVMGDNRNHSEDSRDYGPVPLKNVVGRAVRIFWPWSRRQRLDVPPTAVPVGDGRRAGL